MPHKNTFELRQWFSQQVILPEKGESAAITYNKDKTASLFYDRIYGTVPLDQEGGEVIPESIRCFAGTDVEWQILLFEKHGESVLDWFKHYCTRDNINIQKLLEEVSRPIAIESLELLRDFFEKLINVGDQKGFVTEFILRRISRSFLNKCSVPLVPVYESERDRGREYGEGDSQVIIASLCNLNIVDEKKLTWEQVLQFRQDRDSKQKYRRLMHWLDKVMLGKSQAFIEDEISERLENYERALAKHGIKTIVGTIQQALDGKFLAGASAITGSFTLAGYPVLGILSGTGLLVGNVVVKVAQILLDFDDIERGPNSEISWVYELKRFGK